MSDVLENTTVPNEEKDDGDAEHNHNDSPDDERPASSIIPNIDNWNRANDDGTDMTIIHDCYCPNCNESTGTTTILPTKVPYFREIIIMNLFCESCYFKNSEINFGGEIQLYGEEIHFMITNPSIDLNRQIIKSDSASIRIPILQNFEIPPSTQRGTVSTIEGILTTAANNLDALQSQRLLMNDLDNFYRCQFVIKNLRRIIQMGNDNYVEDEEEKDEMIIDPIIPLEIIVDDIAGNSYIENIYAPQTDSNLTIKRYNRTPQQDMMLGLQPSQQAVIDGTIDNNNPQHKNLINSQQQQQHTITIDKPMHYSDIQKGDKNTDSNNNLDDDEDTTTNGNTTNIGRNEVMKFTTHCSNCYKESETDMCIVDIPHFKEVIIMSMLCESCGYKSNEIKGGGGIPKYGTKITLRCTSIDDLQREVLKSDTAGICIPEIDLELDEGGLDGLYTTIEGLIIKIRDRLQSSNPFGSGDSTVKHHLYDDGITPSIAAAEPNTNTIAYDENQSIYKKYQDFLQKLQLLSEGNLLPCTIIISDPISNSFIGPIAKDAIALSEQAERDGNRSCYDSYVDPNMTIEEYERTYEQNEILGLNDMKTENYMSNDDNNDGDNVITYHGTDQMEELPDRIKRIDIRGPDHPHLVGKAPVENDTTIMGPNSLNYAVPSIGQRSTTTKTTTTTSVQSSTTETTIDRK